MKINRKKFFDNYRKEFGKLNQSKVDNLNFLLTKLESGRFKLEAQIAYILATILHETNDTFYPVVEGYWLKTNRLSALYKYYQLNNRKALSSIFPNGIEGKTYEGRGYVQLTHDWNYDKFGLKDTPEKAQEPETAFMVMEKGMANGIFTGLKLQTYINEEITDYKNARKVINGLDKANLIAGYASKFFKGIELVSDENAMQGYNETDYLT